MRYSDFVKKIADSSGLSQTEVEKYNKTLVEVLFDLMTKGEEVPIDGLGKFSIVKKLTGESIVSFKMSKKVKDSLGSN